MKLNKLGILLMGCLSVGAASVMTACKPAEVVVESITLSNINRDFLTS